MYLHSIGTGALPGRRFRLCAGGKMNSKKPVSPVKELSAAIRRERERTWLRTNRPEAAVHWNLLTGLTAEQLPYADH